MVPESDPKATQMDMGRPLKTYGIYFEGATLGHLGSGRKPVVCCLFSWRLLLNVFCDFC
jgi:hypothetical protein